MNSFQSLIYRPADGSSGPSLQVLDQLLLPREKAYMDVKTVKDAWQVIRDMNVRGAPLIAIVAVLGLGVDVSARKASFASTEEAAAFVLESTEYLKTSRPTAVNLFTAMDQVADIVNKKQQQGVKAGDVVDAVVAEAEKLLKEDVESNEAIGRHGAEAILAGKTGSVKVLTHCNTGSLATAGFGTALGVIRALNAQGRLERVFATETRPYNQGSRLTSFEIVQDGLPGTLITDSMAAFLMATQGLNAVVVGADRIAANGDTANKIGTYQLSVVARHHGVSFYVAAPFTSFDLSLTSGSQIPIEERPAKELTTVQGVQLAPDGIAVWNPGFDVTPAELISGIITERGVIYPSVDSKTGKLHFDVAGFLQALEQQPQSTPLPPPLPPAIKAVPYEALTEARLASFLAEQLPHVWAKLGAKCPQDLKITEVGDGNLNLVFIVLGPRDHVVVKQALPYVRCVGESWPLTLDRAYFENEALLEEYKHCPEHTPEVFFFSRDLALIVMRYIEPPHLILRKALIRGQRLSTVAQDLAVFMARNLFFSSNLHLNGPEKREKVSFWSRNHALCALTEAVIFSEPYFDSPNNRWTSPQLDEDVKVIREDLELKVRISRLKAKFMESSEALLHGDLHTGSVMVKEGSTFVIDPEFAFYGPMGFDTGAILGNFFLSYFSQAGHGNGPDYAQWVLDQAVLLWETFTDSFLQLWNEEPQHKGELYKRAKFRTEDCVRATQGAFMASLLADTLGFAGAKMIRRVLGVAHVEDLESIQDKDLRASCERRVLRAARELVVRSARFSTMQDVAAFIKDTATSQ